nr:ribonucleotide-diphosphate reductase subunit beta [Actinomycetota bacterium]
MPTLEDRAGPDHCRELAGAEPAAQIGLRGPQQLYELWEREPWQSHAIDLGRDRRDWSRLDQRQRDSFGWPLSAFFLGEERVATQLTGLLVACGGPAEESFLASQQVDEVRHMQFFDRFHREVLGLDGGDLGDRLARARGEANDAFVTIVDEALVAAGDALLAAPSDLGAKVDFVTTYHMVIEGTLALTGQHYLMRCLERARILPGLLEGFRHVARDEHRHIAYGAWFLAQTAGRDPALAERCRAKLRELMPLMAGALAPPGHEAGERWELFGYRSEEVDGFAFTALHRRLSAIGVPLAAADPAAAWG